MNFIPHYVDEIYRRMRFVFDSVLSKLYLSWWGVMFGKNLKTRGLLRIKKLPNSKIVIGDNCTFLSVSSSNLIGINRPCILSTQSRSAKLKIGNNCGFSGTVIGAFKNVEIGNNVRCGANTLITDADWHIEDYRSGIPKDVIIHDNVWLGVNSVILKGVTIGENSVIGANSIVTKDIPANVIAAGNPCRVISSINPKNNDN